MSRFTVQARNWDGKIIRSIFEGETKQAVVSRLRERGLFVTGISEVRPEIILFQRRVKPQEIALFSRQFATMIGAGVPLVRCLTILAEQCENSRLQQVIQKLRSDVEAGSNLSRALSLHPAIFTPLFVQLVRAGEAGGILDEILERLAGYLEAAEQLRQKVKGALTYPAVVSCIAVLVVIFLITFVLPSFEAIFKDMGDGQLPMPTRVLLGTSALFNQYFLVIGFLTAAAAVVLKRFLATETGTRLFDSNILKLPAFGPMLCKVAVARFTRTLGTLVASGVPILQALEVTADTAGNVIISDAIHRTRVSIREGESIATPLKQSGVFPPMVVQMIAVGEETGELDSMLIKIADFYDSEVDTAVKGLTSIIEPVVIVFMGIVIGGIVMAIFMPLLDIIGQASH